MHSGKVRLTRIVVLGAVLCSFCCTVRPVFAAGEVTETHFRMYGPVVSSMPSRRHDCSCSAARSGLWRLETAPEVMPRPAAEAETEPGYQAYGPVVSPEPFRRRNTDANAGHSGLWKLRPATPGTFLDSLSMERSRKEIYSQMHDVLFAPGDPFEGIGIDNAEVTDMLEERAFIEALSPKKQYKIMYDRGERNLLILKLKRNKGYYSTQAFEHKRTYALLEKGASYLSLSAGFKNTATASLLIEPFFDVEKIYKRGFSLDASFGYFVKNNVAIGIEGGYHLSDLRLKVSSDVLQLMINSRDYETNNAGSSFWLGFFVKNFIHLDPAHRIFMVTQTSLFYSHGTSVARNIYNDGAMLHKVYQQTDRGGVKLSLGVSYFVAKGFAMEFKVSPVAVYYQNNRVLNNETLRGKFSGGGFNTLFNPIDMQFGLSYFFGLDYVKNAKYLTNFYKNHTKR